MVLWDFETVAHDHSRFADTHLTIKPHLTISDIRWISELREQLEKSGLAVDDIRRLIEGARFFKDHGFNVSEMLVTFSEYKGMGKCHIRSGTSIGHFEAKIQRD